MATKRARELIRKLSSAYVCCRHCGSKYGIYCVGCSSTRMGTCQVCDSQNVPVTDTRDWGYLVTGVHKLGMGFTDPLERVYYEYPLAKSTYEAEEIEHE